MCNLKYNWKTYIIENKPALIDVTSYGPRFIAELIAKDVISKDDIAELDACGSEDLKISKLYDIILKKDNPIEQLLQALIQTGQSGAVAILKGCPASNQEKHHIEITCQSSFPVNKTTDLIKKSCSSDFLIPRGENRNVCSNINNRRNSVSQVRNEIFSWTNTMKIRVAVVSIVLLLLLTGSGGFAVSRYQDRLEHENGTGRTGNNGGPSPSTTPTGASSSIPWVSSENKPTPFMGAGTSSTSSPNATLRSEVPKARHHMPGIGLQFRKKKKIKKEVRYFPITKPSDLRSKVPEICDDKFANRLIFSNANSYNFEKFNYSCLSRVDGIIFLNSNWRIDQIASLLNKTTNLTYLKFKGSSICTRNEGFRVSSMDEISLYDLTHLVFHDLSSHSGGDADCTELYLWMASRVKGIAPKVLSFDGVMITPKNQVDIHQLIFKAFHSTIFRKLDIVGATVNAEMFKDVDEGIPVRELKGVRFHVNNSLSYLAELSLFNLINIYLSGSSIQDFSTNVPVPLKEFRMYVKALHRRNVKRLKTAVYSV